MKLRDPPLSNDQYTAITNGSLANKKYPYSATSGSTGLKYSVKFDGFELGLAVADAQDTKWKNDTTVNGFDEAIRIKVVPMDGLSIGVGYYNDVIDASAGADRYLAVDAMYVTGPFKIFAEYDNKTPNGKDAQGGEYLEGTFKIQDGLSVYVSGTFGCKDSGLVTAGPSKVATNYYAGGLVAQIAPKTALQFEYVSYTDYSDGNSFNVRLKADF